MSEASTPEESADRGSETAETPTVRGWDNRVAAAGLPAETTALVAATVKATKLRRPEKLAVADELIAHFHGADRQGVTPEAARADFGDPAVAATLIRRAKKRNRGLLSRAWTAAKWCFLGFVVFYAALAHRFYSGEPEVKVDYLAKLNATAAAVPEDERAWPEIRRTVETLGFGGQQDPLDLGVVPGDTEWSAARTFLREHSEAVRTLRRAAGRTTLGHLAQPPERLQGVALLLQTEALTVPVRPLRAATRILLADTRAAAERGDADAVAQNLQAALSLCGMATETPALINALAGVSMLTRTIDELGFVLGNHPDLLREDVLRGLATALADAPIVPEDALLGERYLSEDLVQRIYTDDGRGGGRASPDGILKARSLGGGSLAGAPPAARPLAFALAPAAMLAMPGRRSLQSVYDDWFAAVEEDLRTPLAEGWSSAADAFAEGFAGRPIASARYAMVTQLLPATGGLQKTRAEALARRDAALLALALHRHRLTTGGFPNPSTGYAELVPTYLDAVPPDPLHGTPMRWTLRDGQPVVYSLGADGDDDGGIPPLDDLGGNDAAFAPPEDAADGDWIAWPPGG